jgi:hypothetical protein
MKKTAVGFRVHSGWSAVVVVCLEKGEPVVLQRIRMHMVKTFSYAYRQPYHTAEKMELAEAGEFVRGVRAEAEELAYGALRGLRNEMKKLELQLDRGGLLLASGRALPEFARILASHALIHTADGELFREAIRGACRRCGLRLTYTKERELLEQCAEAFSIKPAKLLRRVTEMGREFGAPWTQDEKFAALAGWLALGQKAK